MVDQANTGLKTAFTPIAPDAQHGTSLIPPSATVFASTNTPPAIFLDRACTSAFRTSHSTIMSSSLLHPSYASRPPLDYERLLRLLHISCFGADGISWRRQGPFNILAMWWAGRILPAQSGGTESPSQIDSSPRKSGL